MAANLDRAETSLTAVSDVAYIRAIDGSGNSVRISKADLASVLGGLRYIGGLSSPTDLNNITNCGSYDIRSGVTNWPFAHYWGCLVVFPKIGETIIQFAYTNTSESDPNSVGISSKLCFRKICATAQGGVGIWRNINVTITE